MARAVGGESAPRDYCTLGESKMKVVVIVAALVLSASPVFAADPTMPEMVKAFSSYINGPNSSAFCKLAYESTEKIGDANGHESEHTYKLAAGGWGVCHSAMEGSRESRAARFYAHTMLIYMCRGMRRKGFAQVEACQGY